MELKKLVITNFRGYKNAIIDFSNNINLIIGKNDVGKSTIMDALEIFFNGDSKSTIVKAEVSDCNIYSVDKTMEITAFFKLGENEKVSIDASFSTDLLDEFLLNKENLLEIKKTWNCNGSSLTANSLRVAINSFYPQISETPFLQLKNKDLQKELKKYEQDIPNFSEINKSTNAPMRMALYKHLISEETEFKEIEIEIKKINPDDKDVWTRLKDYLPLFFLFQSDRSNSDSDSEVQNPLKIATKKALSEIQEILDSVKLRVEETVSKIGDETIEKLKDFDSDIAANLKTNLNLKAWDSIFSFDLLSDDNIPLNKRGSGVKRLILLSYFRAEAERMASQNNKRNIIYAIEEPETAQHPDYQKMVLDSLIEIGEDEKHQVIITTHTPEIAKMVSPEDIIFIKKENGNPYIVDDNNFKIKNIADSLGILPTIQSKLVICVEGELDVNFLKNINQSVDELKKIIDLESEDISILPLSGGKLVNWIDRNYLDNSNVIEFHLYDSDVKKYVDLINEINESKDGRRFGVNTSLREMENYIYPDLIEETLRIDLSKYKERWHDIDIPKILLNVSMQQIKDVKKRENSIKGILNSSVAKKITKTHLEALGVYEEVESWFLIIAELYSSHMVVEKEALIQ
ncbi:AAA family ATPase [Bacillus sp. N3536]|nr:AAA family ATPase [Bacillus sp. N3536]